MKTLHSGKQKKNDGCLSEIMKVTEQRNNIFKVLKEKIISM